MLIFVEENTPYPFVYQGLRLWMGKSSGYMSIIQSDQHFIVLSQSPFSSQSFSENMAAPMKKYFNFHFPSDSRQFESLDDKNVCVISVIGKSQYSGKKFSIFSKVLDRDVVLNSSDRQEVCGVNLFDQFKELDYHHYYHSNSLV